ncbi:hypothetical protein [Phycicoccus ginsengisoli]
MAPVRAADAARLAYGAVLLLAPRAATRVVPGSRADGRAELATRLLGLGQVVQAVVLARDDGAQVRRLGRSVDLVHAGGMLVLAAWAPGWGRVALADAAVTALLGTTSDAAPRRARPGRSRPVAPTDDVLDLPAPPHPLGVSLPADDGLDGDPVTRRQRNARLQQAVYDTYLEAGGGEVDHVRRVLVDQVRAAGLEAPPAAWLDAAAFEVAAGNVYVVSGPAMRDVGLELPPHRPL